MNAKSIYNDECAKRGITGMNDQKRSFIIPCHGAGVGAARRAAGAPGQRGDGGAAVGPTHGSK